MADQDTLEIYELYVADAANPSAGSVKLNGPLVAGGYVDEYAVTLDGEAVVYTADEDTLNRRELYIVNLDKPGKSTRLNAPLTVNRDVLDFAVSPDGKQVVYRADQDTADVFELYLVDVAKPGKAVKLSSPLAPDGWVRSGFIVQPRRAVRRVSRRSGRARHGRAVSGGRDRALAFRTSSTPRSSPAATSPSWFAFSPDSATVGYVADQDTDEVQELYAASIATPGVTHKLNGTLTSEGDVCRFEFSPDSTRVAYCADQDTDEVMELYTVALDAPGVSARLNPPLVAGGEVTSGYDFSPDSSFVVYAANQDTALRTDLYRVDVAAPGMATKINADLVADGNVVGFHIRADGTHVGYIANQDDAEVYELYETNLAAPGTATKLSAAMSGGGVFTFRYSPDGESAVYLADQDSDSSEIYGVELDEAGISTRLSDTLTPGGEVWDFAFVK